MTRVNLYGAISVALTLLSMRQSIGIVVVEIGATKLGDIILSCTIARSASDIIIATAEALFEGTGNTTGPIRNLTAFRRCSWCAMSTICDINPQTGSSLSPVYYRNISKTSQSPNTLMYPVQQLIK